jgi:hypothetical protein
MGSHPQIAIPLNTFVIFVIFVIFVYFVYFVDN